MERRDEGFYQGDVRILTRCFISFFALPYTTLLFTRLTVDALTRPTPRDMLAHPWVVNVMKQEVSMARWIRQVWGWPKSNQRSKDGYAILSHRSSFTHNFVLLVGILAELILDRVPAVESPQQSEKPPSPLLNHDLIHRRRAKTRVKTRSLQNSADLSFLFASFYRQSHPNSSHPGYLDTVVFVSPFSSVLLPHSKCYIINAYLGHLYVHSILTGLASQ